MNRMGKIIDKEDNVIEIVLDEKEIDELANKLKELSESKSHIHFSINSDNEMLIHHENDELLK